MGCTWGALLNLLCACCRPSVLLPLQLIRRYFTVAGAKKGDTKHLPGLLCGPGTSNASLFASHMNHMRAPLNAMM